MAGGAAARPPAFEPCTEKRSFSRAQESAAVSRWSTRTRHFAYDSPGSLSLAAVAALLNNQLLRLQSSSTTNSKHPSDIFPPRSRATQANEKPAALQRDVLPMWHDGIAWLQIAFLPRPLDASRSKCRRSAEHAA
jgi:hypothetical protein